MLYREVLHSQILIWSTSPLKGMNAMEFQSITPCGKFINSIDILWLRHRYTRSALDSLLIQEGYTSIVQKYTELQKRPKLDTNRCTLYTTWLFSHNIFVTTVISTFWKYIRGICNEIKDSKFQNAVNHTLRFLSYLQLSNIHLYWYLKFIHI